MPDDQARVAAARLAAAAAVVCASSVAAAQSQPQPIIASDDVRTHGPVARHVTEASVTFERAMGSDQTVDLYSFQLGIGPTQIDDEGKLVEIVGWSNRFSGRVRFTALDVLAGDTTGGPMTVALLRHWSMEQIKFARFLNLHWGLEFAIATPWLSGRMETPPPLLQRTNAVDTELSGNGWSLRPAAPFIRLDFLACRSLHAEIGGAPEAFVSGSGAEPTEYGVRGHVQLGFSFACQHKPTSWRNHFAMYTEYRARSRLYAAGERMQYHDLVALGLQVDVDPVLIGAFVSMDPGLSMGDDLAIGARVQIGFGANK